MEIEASFYEQKIQELLGCWISDLRLSLLNVSEKLKRIQFSTLMVAIGKLIQITSSPAQRKIPSLG